MFSGHNFTSALGGLAAGDEDLMPKVEGFTSMNSGFMEEATAAGFSVG